VVLGMLGAWLLLARTPPGFPRYEAASGAQTVEVQQARYYDRIVRKSFSGEVPSA